MLSTLYPEYDWLPWKFAQSPKKFWDDISNQKRFLEWAGNQLGVKQYSDWYKVTPKVVTHISITSFIGYTSTWQHK
jgi:hypothetical protein